VTFIGGKVIFAREVWYQRFLHNETALAIQKRLYWMARRWWCCPPRSLSGAGAHLDDRAASRITASPIQVVIATRSAKTNGPRRRSTTANTPTSRETASRSRAE